MTARSKLLWELTSRVQIGIPISFVKHGDGEAFCMRGDVGENCDGHLYSEALAQKLKDAFTFFSTKPDVRVVEWDDQDRYQALLHIVGVDIEETKRFWLTVRESDHHKVFVGPLRITGAAKFLKADHVEIPLLNAFERYDEIRSEILEQARPGTVFVFSAGMPAKPWIADVLRSCLSASCIDAGSAFDALFFTTTRTGQLTTEDCQRLYSQYL